MKFKIGCGCVLVPALVLVGFIVWDCRERGYEFELDVCRRVPDLNQYAVVYANINESPEPYGYILYHDAMRDSGFNSLLLTDRLFRWLAPDFFGGRKSGVVEPLNGEAGMFGALPPVELPGQSDVVRIVNDMQPVRDALAAIDTNAVFSRRDSFGQTNKEDVCHLVVWSSGIGAPGGYWKSEEPRDKKLREAKEAMMACAIKVAFPRLKMPRIEEESPFEDCILMMHGRWPVLVRTSVVARRTFNFYSADGALFAKLRIKLEHDRFLRDDLDWNLRKYQAIFRQVFSELKTAKGAATIRGRSYYDAATGTGVIRDLERVEAP